MNRVLILFAAAAVAGAAELPSAGVILDRYTAAIGGKAAHERIRTIHSVATVEFRGTGRTATRSSWRAAPDKSYSMIEIPGLGRMEEGTDGKTAWSENPQRGPHIKSGEERDLAFRAAAWNGEIRLRELYPKIEVAGTADVNGSACYKLVLTPPTGATVTRYFDQQSGLLVKNVMKVTTAMGELDVETEVADYRDIEGIKTPFRITQTGAGPVMVFTIQKLEYNVPIPDSRFALPAGIRQLLK